MAQSPISTHKIGVMTKIYLKTITYFFMFTLKDLAPQVYHLDKYDLRILKYLAEHGPMNLVQLSEYTSKYASGIDRWSLKKHLRGTSRFIGLVPNDYVSEKTKNKKEKTYRLTIKGVLASSSIVPLKENWFFQDYLKFVSKHMKKKRMRKFTVYCVEQFMLLLLSWHALNGIDLTRQKSSSFYYMEFLEHMRNIGSIDITITDKQDEEDFMMTVKNCIACYSVIELLTEHGLALYNSMLSIIDWKNTTHTSINVNSDNFSLEKLMSPGQYTEPWITSDYLVGQYTWEWPLFIGFSGTAKSDITFDEIYSEDIKNHLEILLQDIEYQKKASTKIS